MRGGEEMKGRERLRKISGKENRGEEEYEKRILERKRIKGKEVILRCYEKCGEQ